MGASEKSTYTYKLLVNLVLSYDISHKLSSNFIMMGLRKCLRQGMGQTYPMQLLEYQHIIELVMSYGKQQHKFKLLTTFVLNNLGTSFEPKYPRNEIHRLYLITGVKQFIFEGENSVPKTHLVLARLLKICPRILE